MGWDFERSLVVGMRGRDMKCNGVGGLCECSYGRK